MNFCIGIPVLNQEEQTLKTIFSYYDNAIYPNDIPLIILDNGSNPLVSSWIWKFSIKYPLVKILIYRNDENTGVTKALNKIWELAKNNCCKVDYILYSHSDVTIMEHGWDERLRGLLNEEPGVVGFGGALGIGFPNIKHYAYSKILLQRILFFSNMNNAEDHGYRLELDYCPCSVLDGFTLCINLKLLNKINGFDTNYIFHMYDNDICLESLKHGFKNYILGIYCHHFGGTTSTKSDYQDWAKEKYGGDSEIHNDSHWYFYNKWINYLPYMVNGVEVEYV